MGECKRLIAEVLNIEISLLIKRNEWLRYKQKGKMMKREIDTLSAIPSKQIFMSIINDYDLNLAICELIDNALDIWFLKGRGEKLLICLELDKMQQRILIKDNAGGIKFENLKYIVSPGLSTTLSSEETIGVFGVGSKRAVVALSGDIQIKSRYSEDDTFLVEFDDEWLGLDDWTLPIYKISQIENSTTIIELQKLRFFIKEETIGDLRKQLSYVYAKFLFNYDVEIIVNNEIIQPKTFERWAYPPDYEPREYNIELNKGEEGEIKIDIIAGLTKESSPAGGEYGVYFYCNNRLIVKEQKDHNVGFIKGVAGLAHPSVSLVRVIVSLTGPANNMPWNSSKSQINPNHNVFQSFRDFLFEIVKYYASLSRRTSGDWPNLVFKYTTGRTVKIDLDDGISTLVSYLPDLPKTRQTYGEKLKSKNEEIVKKWPWTQGLYESLVAIEVIARQKLAQRNRIILILLDSTIEIAIKEFLIHNQKIGIGKFNSIKNNRTDIQNELKRYKRIAKKYWDKVDYYYKLRCDLIHERSTPMISDEHTYDYWEIVKLFLRRLFGLEF